MTETINLTPDYTPEEQERLNTALQRQDDAIMRVDRTFAELYEIFDGNPAFRAFLVRHFDDAEEADAVIASIEVAYSERNAANDELLRAIARRP